MSIGIKLRDLRNKYGLTQEELADRCDLTKGYISQLENDLTSPSISTLTDILTVLGTSLKDFFGDDEEQIAFREEDYFEKAVDTEVVTWLVPNSQKNAMEPIILILNPGCQTDLDYPHEGEEFGYLLEGKIKLVYGNREVELSKGETFYYIADKNHYLINNGKTKAKIIWVTCPPNF